MTSTSGKETGLRSGRHADGYQKASAFEEERGIVKPLPAETFVDYRDGEAEPEDPTGDLAYNAEMRWEVDGGAWRMARLFGENVPGAWARWSLGWDADPGRHEIRVRATDGAGNAQPNTVGWNDLGYLYDGVVGHPVEVL